MRILALAICLLTLAGARAAAQCVGDCNGDGSVSISELILGVDIALGAVPISSCRAFATANGRVSVTQLVEGVANALDGCPGPRFVDNGDGTVTDTQGGLIWEKKDEGGGLHDVNTFYAWAGNCSDNNADCQPDAAAASTCTELTGGADGCAQCGGATMCITYGYSTIWQWLNQLNATHFAGHSDWRIPTVGRDGDAPQLETILDIDVVPACGEGYIGTGPACVPAAFNTSCTDQCAVVSCSCTYPGPYWSATTDARSPGGAWLVDFSLGAVGGVGKDDEYSIRAVRTAP